MTYMDMTFCPFWKDCVDGEKCHRALTEKVLARRDAWIKDGPICQYAEKPSCHEPTGKDEK